MQCLLPENCFVVSLLFDSPFNIWFCGILDDVQSEILVTDAPNRKCKSDVN
uniref:Uncharacterized protein n=1 Tax=Arundo donax TaxID=35708 RepID=A0A0A9EL35_ARUDO